MTFGSTTTSAAAAAQRLRVRSALNPVLWLVGIGSPITLGAAYIFRDHPVVMGILVAVGVAPILTACAGFVYFALRKSEKLQSEDYQLRHEALQVIQERVGHGVIDVSAVTAIANPAVAALPPGGGQ
jgi:beta-lactamase regulating signal transducer with metallopeptidase domain